MIQPTWRHGNGDTAQDLKERFIRARIRLGNARLAEEQARQAVIPHTRELFEADAELSNVRCRLLTYWTDYNAAHGHPERGPLPPGEHTTPW